MEELLERANEIGLLIKETDEYKMYEKARTVLQKNGESSKLFEQYIVTKEIISQRRQQGDIIEKYEDDALVELEKRVKEDEIVSNFLAAQGKYAMLLVEIQENIR